MSDGVVTVFRKVMRPSYSFDQGYITVPHFFSNVLLTTMHGQDALARLISSIMCFAGMASDVDARSESCTDRKRRS
jgi:hypothetical protein